MIFVGMHPLPSGKAVVEVQSGSRVFDLHNWATFEGFELQLPETLSLKFDYDATFGGRQTGDSGIKVELRFQGVEGLRVDKTEMESKHESDTLGAIIYRDLGERGALEIVFMDGLTLRFSSGALDFIDGQG